MGRQWYVEDSLQPLGFPGFLAHCYINILRQKSISDTCCARLSFVIGQLIYFQKFAIHNILKA